MARPEDPRRTATGAVLLDEKAAKLGIKVPTAATLKKYGLTALDWLIMLDDQSWVCPVMGATPGTGRFVIDHEHVPGWAKMPPEERKKYVRGLVSWYANHAYVGGGISIERATNVLDFLKNYEMRRPRRG
jgi:hypothetical protein